ncbi:hypothetical protein FQN54_002285 [Arachnomyces sp. PD_36]|nr:hypothetical protein FQN54_002285 [Arachnomyces sp. PD_36]
MSLRLSTASLSAQARQGPAGPLAFHLHSSSIIIPYTTSNRGPIPSPSHQRRSLTWWGYRSGRWPSDTQSSQKKVPRRDRPYIHKCMPHGRHEVWRERHPEYNLRVRTWAKRNGPASWRDRGYKQSSDREVKSPWEDSHQSLWKEFEEEHNHFDKQFEEFKRRVDADPFGALFGRRLQRLNYHPHLPNFWMSIFNSLFGQEQPRERKTINVEKAEKDIDDKTFSTVKATDTSNKTTSTADTTPEKSTPESSSDTNVSFEFDPISGRMVPKTTSPSVDSVTSNNKEDGNGVDIPVKTFKKDGKPETPQASATAVGETVDTASTGNTDRPNDVQASVQKDPSPESSDNSGTTSHETRFIPVDNTEGTEKSQTGSTEKEQDSFVGQMGNPKQDTPSWSFWRSPNLKSLFGRENAAEEKTPQKAPNQQTFEDPRDEDLDLLRSSDIRASYGSAGAKQNSGETKTKSHEELEREFDSYSDTEGHISAQDLRSRARGEETTPVAAANNETAEEKTQRENIDHLADEIQGIYEDTYGKIYDPKSRAPARDSNTTDEYVPEATEEAKAPGSTRVDNRSAPAQIDSQDPTPSTTVFAQYDLPAAEETIDNMLFELRHFERSIDSLRDELHETINQFTSITEDGPLRTARYKILAYDPSSSRVINAEVTSSASSAEQTPLSLEDFFSNLDNPASFVPHLAALDAQGYEVVSGAKNVLVFKKVRTIADKEDGDKSSIASDASKSPSQIAHPATESISEVEGNPTIPHPDPFSASSPSSPTSHKVHRQETVFTGGPPNWSPYPPSPPIQPNTGTDHPSSSSPGGDGPKKESFLHKTSRRVILTGVATAGTCYALGVVSEYFRTGGQDGKGPEGFTAI